MRSISALFTWAARIADDRAGYLVLDGEHILELPVVALGPAMNAGHGIDELRRDAHAVTAAANAALQDVAHAKFAARPGARRPPCPCIGSEELRAMTNSSENRDSSVMMSSVMPSQK